MPHGTHNSLPDARNKSILISINGELFPRSEAKISVFDSGYLVGDGIWEGIRLHKGSLLFLDQHLDRMYEGAAKVKMDIPTRDEVIESIWQVLKANEMESDVHIRLMITRGNKKTPSQDPRFTITGPNIVIIPEYKVANPESRDKGLKLHTASIRRSGSDFLDPRLNCHSKLHEVITLNEALEAGCDEALMLDPNGNVATCNSTNFFMIKDGIVFTSTGEFCLNGITRAKVIRVCEENDIECRQTEFTVEDVYEADEAFVTGTFGGLTPVRSLDGKAISNASGIDLTSRLRDLYYELVEREVVSR